MTVEACADLVRRADPERFLATMAAPAPARAVLFALYAMNVEVARAPWVTRETLIAEMRLQWWRDALAGIAAGGKAGGEVGSDVAGHEILTPLAGFLTPDLAGALDSLIEARRWDIYREPFADRAALEAHIDATAGTLLRVAARRLGPADDAVVSDLAHASGLANWLRAVPELSARGRAPLPDPTDEGIRALARHGLARLARARAARAAVSARAGAALLAGWQAGPVLRQALDDPGRVAAGALGQGEARKRLTLMARAATGRW
ncbi:MAG: squalene/phytoene synthase family protein [Jhaorihella sp.]